MTVAELASSGPAPFGLDMNHDGQVYARDLPLFAFAPVLAYFAWQRRLNVRAVAVVAGALTLAAVVMNAYPFEADGDTVILATLHLALALWLVVGVAYVGETGATGNAAWTSSGSPVRRSSTITPTTNPSSRTLTQV